MELSYDDPDRVGQIVWRCHEFSVSRILLANPPNKETYAFHLTRLRLNSPTVSSCLDFYHKPVKTAR